LWNCGCTIPQSRLSTPGWGEAAHPLFVLFARRGKRGARRRRWHVLHRTGAGGKLSVISARRTLRRRGLTIQDKVDPRRKARGTPEQLLCGVCRLSALFARGARGGSGSWAGEVRAPARREREGELWNCGCTIPQSRLSASGWREAAHPLFVLFAQREKGCALARAGRRAQWAGRVLHFISYESMVLPLLVGGCVVLPFPCASRARNAAARDGSRLAVVTLHFISYESMEQPGVVVG
jgi:hypothetical protein